MSVDASAPILIKIAHASGAARAGRSALSALVGGAITVQRKPASAHTRVRSALAATEPMTHSSREAPDGNSPGRSIPSTLPQHTPGSDVPRTANTPDRTSPASGMGMIMEADEWKRSGRRGLPLDRTAARSAGQEQLFGCALGGRPDFRVEVQESPDLGVFHEAAAVRGR